MPATTTVCIWWKACFLLSLWYMNCERRFPTSGARSAPAPVNLCDLNDIMIKINDIVFHDTKNILCACAHHFSFYYFPLYVHVHRFSSLCVVVKWIWRENRVVYISYGLCHADHLYILLIDWWHTYFVVCACHTIPYHAISIRSKEMKLLYK